MALNHDFVNNNSGEYVNRAADFLKAIFNQQAGSFLEIKAFPTDKDEPIQNFFSIPPESDVDGLTLPALTGDTDCSL